MDFITKIVVSICSRYQLLLSLIIYGAIFFQFGKVVKKIVCYNKKLDYVEDTIKLINKTKIKGAEKTVDDKMDEEKLEIITNNFPIMVQEIKDVYDKRKPKQISAIDLFENNLVISSSDEIKLRTWINSFTSLGLLGTFIGLVSSVLKIDPEQTSEGITALLSSMAPAIATTIVGVIASLVASYMLTNTKSKYKAMALDLEKEMMSQKPSDTNPDYFYDSFTTLTGEKYEVALAKIVDNFLERMKESLTKDLEAYKNAINDAINNLSENEEKFNTAAVGLETTVDKINNYLQKTDELNLNFEQKLKDFTLALGSFNKNFENTNKKTTDVLENIQLINQTTKDVNGALYESLKVELEEIRKAFELMKQMNYNFRNEIMNTPALLDVSIRNLCKNIEMLSYKIDERAKNTMNGLSNNNRNVINNNGE